MTNESCLCKSLLSDFFVHVVGVRRLTPTYVLSGSDKKDIGLYFNKESVNDKFLELSLNKKNTDITSLYKSVYKKSVLKLNNRIDLGKLDFASDKKVLFFVPEFATKEYRKKLEVLFSNVDIYTNKTAV